MSDTIAEIDQSEFDNVPASVPLTMHDSNEALLEPIVSKDDIINAIESAIIEPVEQTETEPQQQEEPIIQTVDITEPIVNDIADQAVAVESTHIAAAADDEHVKVPHHAPEASSSDEVVHEIDSQEARDAALLAEEEAEDKQDDIEEIHRELEDASAATRKKQQQDALLRAIQEALSGTSGQSMEMFGIPGDDYYDDEEDEQDEPDVPADTSMLAWLKSNILPSVPVASFFTRRSLDRNAKLLGLKAGRFAWGVSTAVLLMLVPYVIAHANELAFVDQFRETNRLQDLLNDAQSKGYEGHHSGAFGVPSQPQIQQAHAAKNAPTGYSSAPVTVSGIPPQ